MSDTVGLEHGTAQLATGVRIHYVTAGAGPRTIVLLHGYPQTWWEWRRVIPQLVQEGYRIVAPDYRGAGGSSKPSTGFDKRTMAADIRALLHDHLGLHDAVVMVGHDIGMMVAYAFASSFPEAVSRLVLAEAPLPGTRAYDRLVAVSRLATAPMWHFFFHNAQDNLAEALTAGRERLYLQHFYDRLAFDPAAIGPADLDTYVHSFAKAGAMRAGFELYRAFDQDAADNRAVLERSGRLDMPVLGLGGEASFFLPIAAEMLAEVAADVRVMPVARAGHWLAEENPDAVAGQILRFCARDR